VNGPAHYAAAELRLRASDWQRQEAGMNGDDLTSAMHEATCAQVHATLALAAATALGLSDGGTVAGMRLGDAEAWENACSIVREDDVVEAVIYCSTCDHPEHPGRTCTVVTSGVLSCGCTP